MPLLNKEAWEKFHGKRWTKTPPRREREETFEDYMESMEQANQPPYPETEYIPTSDMYSGEILSGENWE